MPSPFFTPSPHDQAIKWIRGNDRPRVRTLSFHRRPVNVWGGGTIVAVDDSSFAQEFGTHNVALWPDTTIPIRQLLVDVQTDERIDSFDDGMRRMWIKQENLYTPNGTWRRGTQYGMLIAALAEAGIPEQLPEVGGQLWMRWVGTVPEWRCRAAAGPVDRRLWEVRYERPST